jgi:hypothetical protein
MMGEVVAFRRKRLSGFIPDPEDAPPPAKDQDTSPSETNPDSGDCA